MQVRLIGLGIWVCAGGGRESRIGEGGEGICKGKVGEGGGDVMLRMDGGFGRWIGRVLFIWQGRSGWM